MVGKFKETFPQVTVTERLEQWINDNPRVVWLMCQWGPDHTLVETALGWLSFEDQMPDALMAYFWEAATIEEGGDGELDPAETILQLVGAPTRSNGGFIDLGQGGMGVGHGTADMSDPNGKAGNGKGYAHGSIYINTSDGSAYLNQGSADNVDWVLIGAQSP